MRALIQRINRRLARDDEQMRKYPGGRWVTDLGEYYIVNYFHNFLVQGHVDPEALGRELGALRDWEGVEEPV
jgi:hypothetical protein